MFEDVQFLPRFALGGAPAPIVEIEHRKTSLGKQGSVRVDVRFHSPEAWTHDDPGMSAWARRVQVRPQDSAVFGQNLGSPHIYACFLENHDCAEKCNVQRLPKSGYFDFINSTSSSALSSRCAPSAKSLMYERVSSSIRLAS